MAYVRKGALQVPTSKNAAGYQVYHQHAWTYTMSIKGPGRDVSIRGTLKPLKRSAEEAGLPTGGPFTMVRDCDTMAAQIREDARVAAANHQCDVQDTQEYDPQDTVLDEAALETPGTPGTPPSPDTDKRSNELRRENDEQL